MQKLKLFFLTLSILFFFIKGNGQWSVNPSENNPVCTLGGNQTSSQIISDGASGAIIIWEDYRNGNYDIYASRIDANGYKLWGTDGVAICTEPYGQQLPGIISDGVGGAIIAWRDYRDFYPAEGTSIDVYAQRVNASGVVQWTVGGVPICKAQYRQQDVAIVGDGMGGAIIAWNDSRVDNMKSRIYAQRISADGIVQWATDGIAVSLLADVRNHPRIATDGAGGAIIVWQDERDELSTKSDIYVQRINSSGTVVWNAGGVAICTLANYQLLPELVSDGVGGAIMTWFDYRGGNADIYAQRVNGSGVPQWTSNGVPTCTKAKNQYSPMIVSDASGGAIITWN
ncbi:MAG: hypothetical protein HYZ34_07220, partial [Ignavibacteriae bacterium]|nr:hypothetical protein [Ignavibacteriota bacterium]